ncbi:MAG: ATP-binding protein [Bacteroidota bacterium]
MIEFNAVIITDICWVAALIAMGVFGAILLRAHLRPSAARWFSFLMVAGGVNIFGVVITDIIDANYQLGLRAISIGRAFLPYCMLGFSLVFPYRRRLACSKTAFFALAIPSLVTMVVTDPYFAPRDIAYQLKYHIPWMGGYFIWSYANLFGSFRRARLAITRRQHVMLSLGSVPPTMVHYTTSILLPAFGRDNIWRYNWIPILGAFVLVMLGYVRYGFLRKNASLSHSLLDRSIDAAGVSSQIVAHAVKNTLQLIRSHAEMAIAQDGPDRQARIGHIVSLCDELSERMNKLNLLTRANICLTAEHFRITEPLERAIERARPRLDSVRIVREYLNPAPFVSGDRTNLEEAFLNLVTNAAEAMPGGGELRIEIRMENDWVLVGFHDRGVGIDPERLPRIFEPFQTTKVPGHNWGIGLSYCHLVLERLGGDLMAESTRGKGSSFYAVLPLAVEGSRYEAGIKQRKPHHRMRRRGAN